MPAIGAHALCANDDETLRIALESKGGKGDLVVVAVEDLGKLDAKTTRSVCAASWLTRELLA